MTAMEPADGGTVWFTCCDGTRGGATCERQGPVEGMCCTLGCDGGVGTDTGMIVGAVGVGAVNAVWRGLFASCCKMSRRPRTIELFALLERFDEANPAERASDIGCELSCTCGACGGPRLRSVLGCGVLRLKSTGAVHEDADGIAAGTSAREISPLGKGRVRGSQSHVVCGRHAGKLCVTSLGCSSRSKSKRWCLKRFHKSLADGGSARCVM